MKRVIRRNKIIILFLIYLFLVSLFAIPSTLCQTSSPSPTPIPIASFFISPVYASNMTLYGPASINYDGSKIAFVANANNHRQLFVVNSDGTGLKQLTADSREYSFPYINGDDRKIVCISYKDNTLPDGYHYGSDFRLVMFNSDGTNLITLVSNQVDLDVVQPSTSRDGTKVTFRAYPANTSNADRDNRLALYVINSDGTGLAKLASNLFEIGVIEASPDISGDGSKIVFTANIHDGKAIFIINSDGTGLKELAQNSYDPGNNWKYPQISDDGSKVVFSAYSIDSYKIFVVNSDATGLRQIAQSPTKIKYYEGYENPSIDGDGDKVVFNSYIEKNGGGGSRNIFVMNSDGTGLEQITSNVSLFQSISGDGKKIVYTWQNGIYIVQLTADSTPSATPTTNPTNTAFPSLTVPEFSWLAILPLFFSILSIAVLTRKRKVSLIK